MKSHFCKAENTILSYENKCNWCGETEMKLEQAARQALDALETDEQWGFVNKKVLERRLPAITALRKALAEQAEQEPVAEVHNTDTPSNWSIIKPGLPAGTKLYAAPVRTKDLTDDEIDYLIDEACQTQMPYDMFARAVIAADREKNK